MNATQTLVLSHLEAHPHSTVAELVELVGKGETTVRKALREMDAEQLVQKSHTRVGAWEIVPAPEPQPEPATEDKPRKRYTRHIGENRTQTTRINQLTKCVVGVRRAEDHKDEAEKFGITTKWYTVCETHDVAHGEEKLLDAHWYSTYPLFDKAVRKAVQAGVGRRRANKNTYPESAAKWMPKN